MSEKEIIKKNRVLKKMWELAGEVSKLIDKTIINTNRTYLKILFKIVNESENPIERIMAVVGVGMHVGMLHETLGQERAEEIILG